MIKQYFTGFSFIIISSFLLSGCTAHKEVKASNSNPKFLNNIALDKKSNNIGMENVVSRHKHNKGSKATTITDDFMQKPVKVNSMVKDFLDGPITEKYACFMGVPPAYVSNYILYKFIDEWYGVPYCLGGSTKDGIDCSAFAQKLFEEVFCTNLLRTATEQFSKCKLQYDNKNLKEGDLVFFHIRSKNITHVGIYLMNQYFVHASASQGVMISSLNEAYWHKYYAGAGSIPLNQNM